MNVTEFFNLGVGLTCLYDVFFAYGKRNSSPLPLLCIDCTSAARTPLFFCCCVSRIGSTPCIPNWQRACLVNQGNEWLSLALYVEFFFVYVLCFRLQWARDVSVLTKLKLRRDFGVSFCTWSFDTLVKKHSSIHSAMWNRTHSTAVILLDFWLVFYFSQ